MGYRSQISWSGSEASWLPMSCILAGRGAGQAGYAARSLENMCNSWISAILSFLKQVHPYSSHTKSTAKPNSFQHPYSSVVTRSQCLMHSETRCDIFISVGFSV